MRLCLALICALCLPAALAAQTAVNVTGNTILWDQAGPDLASVQSWAYRYVLDGGAEVPLTSVTCSGSASPFQCQAPIPPANSPPFTVGTHALILTAVLPSMPPTMFTIPPPTPVDCVVSAWSAWSTCTNSQQTRTRTIVTPPANGGMACPALTETQACTVTTGPIVIGEATILPTADSGNGNLLVAQSAVLSQAATLQTLSFYVTTTGGGLRLGVYDATGSGGGPGQLKAQTAAVTPVAGWNTQPVTVTVSLAPGTYWLAYFPQSNALGFRKTENSSSSGRYVVRTYGAFPATFPAASVTPSHWSFSATLGP